MRDQIVALDRPGYKSSNPILQAQRLQELLTSTDPQVLENLPVYEMFRDISSQLGMISYRVTESKKVLTCARAGQAMNTVLRNIWTLEDQKVVAALRLGASRE